MSQDHLSEDTHVLAGLADAQDGEDGREHEHDQGDVAGSVRPLLTAAEARQVSDAAANVLAPLISGALSALWSASGYLTAFRYALHTMYGLPDHRPPLRGAHPHPLPHRAPH
ncbi:hypothetical protein [Streptomyces sp. bgisy126]|uniref:hypothetical protein n=1 Tax=unclassified Streptomyces TaxID=2593676 RepID=UPI003EC0BE03